MRRVGRSRVKSQSQESRVSSKRPQETTREKQRSTAGRGRRYLNGWLTKCKTKHRHPFTFSVVSLSYSLRAHSQRINLYLKRITFDKGLRTVYSIIYLWQVDKLLLCSTMNDGTNSFEGIRLTQATSYETVRHLTHGHATPPALYSTLFLENKHTASINTSSKHLPKMAVRRNSAADCETHTAAMPRQCSTYHASNLAMLITKKNVFLEVTVIIRGISQISIPHETQQ